MATDILTGPGASAVDWDDNDEHFSGGIPPQEVKHNPDGTKTVIDYSMSDDGYLAVTTTVLKVDKVTKTVSRQAAARRNWAKFGECAGKPAGLERGISTVSFEEVNVEWVAPEDDAADDDDDVNYEALARSDIQSRLKAERFRQRQEERKLGVANWAQKMSLEAAAKNPNAPPAAGMRAPAAEPAAAAAATTAAASAGAGTGGKYVPPSKRAGASGTSMGDSGPTSYSRDDSATVRISNISHGTEEADLEELCKTFGPIRRIFLSRDRETGESKGFAFVAFQSRPDAEKCINRLDGHGYDHLILSVEWSKPKEPRDSDPSRQASAR